MDTTDSQKQLMQEIEQLQTQVMSLKNGQDQLDTVRQKYKSKTKRLKTIIRDLTGKLGKELALREAWTQEKQALLKEIDDLRSQVGDPEARVEHYREKARRYKHELRKLQKTHHMS